MKMTKRAGRIIIGLLLFILIGGMVWMGFFYLKREYKTIYYKESQKEIANPWRGLYFQIDASQSDRFASYHEEEDNFRIMLLTFNLSGFEGEEILPDWKREELSTALRRAKKQQFDVIVRTAYDFQGQCKEPGDFNIVLSHAKQTAEIINLYPEIVMGVQAGFIGPYGEWHSSPYMENAEDGTPYRVKLLEVLLNNLKEPIAVNVRRPMFIREAVKYGLDGERIGYHDDALLSTDTDMGTYVEEGFDREKELDWAEENIKTPVNGGEMTNISEYTQPANAVREFHKLKISYLNRYYNQEVLEDWKNKIYEGENAYDYIINHLGYRLSLSSLKTVDKIRFMQSLPLSGTLYNSGFSGVSDKFKLYAVVKTESGLCSKELKMTQKSKTEISFAGRITFPAAFWKTEWSEDMKVGFVMTDSIFSEWQDGDFIELANDEKVLEGGCNYFVSYRFQNKGKIGKSYGTWQLKENN